jgi:4,5:9,10-diseco-3-hydroxy-5,9,17-trioxoandrosta-1(10),2-diene-4-oate hydrolase
MEENNAAGRDPIERKLVETETIRLSYLAAGDGLPMVLLHGIGNSAADWRWVIPRLAKFYRVYALDWPGSGDSTVPARDCSPAFFEDTLLGFLDAARIRDPILVGNSLGGLVSVRAAAAEPSRFPALVLVDSAGLGREVHASQQLVAIRGIGEAGMAWGLTPPGSRQRAWLRAELLFHRLRHVPPEWFEEQQRLALRPGFLRTWLEALRTVVGPEGQREILLDLLAELTMPALVVWGKRDRVVPLKHAHEAVSRLARGELAVIPDCGHVPHIEQPERFAQAVLGFLEEHLQAVPHEESHG